MAGATHPFFGNQYTDGGYIIGSFKFPEGLTRMGGERLAKIAVPNTMSMDTIKMPSVRNTTSLNNIKKNGASNKWIIPAIIIAAITAAGGYFAYRYFRRKGIIKIPNVGVCEHCGKPLTGARLIPDDNNPYIICRKCGAKNFAHYHDENSSTSRSVDGNDI
ncbi:hypothetical protein LJC04_04485 [Ruminococcaceae bacterium OttesenSCG-928-O06]|nr:hypothetical protein [Ruminococcaceae bacterium OttesenSCG-928-O06]